MKIYLQARVKNGRVVTELTTRPRALYKDITGMTDWEREKTRRILVKLAEKKRRR